MPARAAWKGFLNIHQLQVPVKAFTAVSSQPEIALNQLHTGCGSRVRQFKVCPVHGELTTDDIGCGYEFAEGQLLPLEASELESLLAEDTKAISVDCFIPAQTIDPVYHSGRTYYVVPDGPPGQRPFNVLREGMRSSERLAVSRIVINHREQLVLLRPLGRLIAMTVLEYPQRVRAVRDYEGEVATIALSDHEQQLARQLIEALTPAEFDVSTYRDPYMEGLAALIERRLAAQGSAALAARTTEPSVEGLDEETLVAALRASLSAAGIDEELTRIPSRTDRSGSNDLEPPISKRA